MSETKLLPCPFCGADEASTYLGAPGPGVVRCFASDCGAIMDGYSTDEEAIDAWNRRSVAMDAAYEEAYGVKIGSGEDSLTECFRHHVRTTIGWQAFGARPGPEMHMYEEGFKAGYRRCKSDNELELGEAEDIAAPDLVAELKRMVEHFSTWANDHSDEATTETWAALYCAREAITKAGSRQ